MPVTLAQAALNAQDDVQIQAIDEFRKSSYLLDAMTFDDVVNPAGGGGTLTYGYQRVVTQPTAAFRAINSEYAPQESTKQRYTVDLKPLGGSFQIDRVLADVGAAAANEVTFQMEQKIKASRSQFHDAAINGDSGANPDAFDGLDVALTGSTTELYPTAEPSDDWTTINSQAEAFAAMELLDELLAALDGTANAILGNSRSIRRTKQIARWAGHLTQSEDAFGNLVDTFDGVALIDLGDKPGSNDPIIPIEARDVNADATTTTGLTDLYAVRFGLDGLHGVSMAGRPLVQTWLPDFSTSGAVKTGEVELGPSAIVLKATKAAAVLRNIKVQ